MKLLITSDLHLEFHADQGHGLLASLDPSGEDVLVVAGDLATAGMLRDALTALCERFPHVVYVRGNHEYYHSSPDEVRETMRSLARRLRNLHWLNHSTAEIDGDYARPPASCRGRGAGATAGGLRRRRDGG